MNRLGLAAIGYTPDDKVPRPDEGEIEYFDSKGFTHFFLFCLWIHPCFSVCVLMCFCLHIRLLE